MAWRRLRKAGIDVMDGRVLQQKSCPCPIMEVAMSQRYLSPSRVDGEQEKTKTKQEMKGDAR
jgi:hypothetical protein